jgi:O-antigen ligase
LPLDAATKDRWSIIVAGFVLAILLVGGTSAPPPMIRFAFSCASLVLLIAAVVRLRTVVVSRQAYVSFLLIGAVVLAFALQLVPLPPVIYDLLPGRDRLREIDEIVGVRRAWRSISLRNTDTRDSLMALLPGLAMFMAVLTVRARQWYKLIVAVVVAAVANVLLGLAQQFAGGDSFRLYEQFAMNTPSGFFANRNFLAASLYSSIPMLASLALLSVRARLIPGWLACALALAYFAIVITGLAVSGSRAGVVLTLISIAASLVLTLVALRSWGMNRRSKLAMSMIAVLAVVLTVPSFAGLARLIDADPLDDYRLVILDISWPALAAFWPVGSGFGTFIQTYQLFEKPEIMLAAYVNHAHNDWLEIVLEGGAAAALLIFIFLSWFFWSLRRIWSKANGNGEQLIAQAASISASLLLGHSAIDYPLRTPALMSLFAVCMALMVLPLRRQELPRPDFGLDGGRRMRGGGGWFVRRNGDGFRSAGKPEIASNHLRQSLVRR